MQSSYLAVTTEIKKHWKNLTDSKERTVLYRQKPSENFLELDPPYNMQEGVNSHTYPIETYTDTPKFDVVFNSNNSTHVEYIKKSTNEFNRLFTELKRIDNSFHFPFIAYWLTTVPQYINTFRPFSSFSTVGFLAQQALSVSLNYLDEAILMFIAGRAMQRSDLFAQYHRALTRQLQNMAWTLGYQTEAEEGLLQLHDSFLLKMVLSVSTVVDYQTIKNIIADPIEKEFLEEAKKQADIQKLLSQRRSNTHMDLYGINSASYLNFFTIGPNAIKDTYFAAQDAVFGAPAANNTVTAQHQQQPTAPSSTDAATTSIQPNKIPRKQATPTRKNVNEGDNHVVIKRGLYKHTANSADGSNSEAATQSTKNLFHTKSRPVG